MMDGQHFIEQPVNRIGSRIELFIAFYREYFDTGINEESAKNVKDPVKSFNQHNTHGNKNNPEHDRHQDANQQGTGNMIGADFEITKDEDENKDVIDTQAPFHEVSTEVFQGRDAVLPPPQKRTKGKGKKHPEEGLPKRLFHADFC